MSKVEVTLEIEESQLWLLRRRYGKRKGDGRLVGMAVAEVVKIEARALLAEEGYSAGASDAQR